MGDNRLSEQIKNRWHETCFKRVGVPAPTPENKNRIKYHWEPNDNAVSLRRFVLGLIKSGDQQAQDWMDHKKGILNQPRSETNAKVAREAGAQSRLARKSKKSAGSAPAKETKVKAAKGI